VITGGAATAFLAACGGSEKSTSATATSEIPDETSGVVRQDITTSFGDASGTADGVPTTIEMTLLDVASGGGPLAGAAVYLWHCTADGQYSMYDPQIADENFLRGVQESGKDGKVTFTSIFPGAYSGRWPHIHFEVYESLDAATQAGTTLKTSQIATATGTPDSGITLKLDVGI
jgi:protocatechuate 3,4-dioxygenase beta subunit